MDIDYHFKNEVPVINIGADEGRLTDKDLNDILLSPRVESIVTMAGVDRFFTTYDSKDEIR